MADEIGLLNDEQTVHAVRLFFDFAPPEVWEGNHKPSVERVKTVAAALVREAPPELKPVLGALAESCAPEIMAVRAEVCRIILGQANRSPALRPYVTKAVSTALKPHMGIDPSTGAFIIALLLVTSKKVGGGQVIVDMIGALRLPELLHELPEVVKALPEQIFSKLKELPFLA
jgi:hypothetical protein